jgi:erythromycin esterase
VLPLFEYIKETRSGNRPLHLAGFDMTPSTNNAYRGRLAFITDVVGRLDPVLSAEVEGWERTLIAAETPELLMKRLGEEVGVLYGHYEELLAWFDQHEDELVALFPSEPEFPLVARQLVWTTLNLLEFAQANHGTYCEQSEIRDHGMAMNLSHLAQRVFPGKKIIVWAHNYHIRYDNVNTRSWRAQGSPGCHTMGEEVARRYRLRDGVYTIGLYMYEGTAAQNDRGLYPIPPADPNSMEGYLAEAGEPYLFLDLLHADLLTAPAWVHSSVMTRTWGNIRLFMVPRDQYDGVLLIRKVNPPEYVSGW